MKTVILLTVFAFLPLLILSQDNKSIVIGQIHTLPSKILHEKRTIWVHVPKSYFKGSTQRYPVVYILDGDDHFSSVVGVIEQFSESNGNSLCPEMVVVGILNTDRDRDLTPTIPTDTLVRKSLPTAGGGEAFTSFLKKELMPFIDNRFPTQPYKLLIGHSFGGLMVINTLINHPSLFNGFICIDPSMWWQKGELLQKAKQVLASQSYPTKSLYLGLANLLPPGMNVQQARSDTTRPTRGMRYNLSLMDALEANKQNELHYAGKYYPEDDHSSVPLITEYDAFRFIFSRYRMPFSSKTLFEPSFKTDSAFVAHYNTVSQWMGYHVLPPESVVHYWGDNYLYSGPNYLVKAGNLLKLNVANYPQSYRAHGIYGDYFVAQKDTANAVIQFQKSLSLKETTEVRKKLTALQLKAALGSSTHKPKK